MTTQTITVQTRSSITCMVLQEWTEWGTMEPSSLHRPTRITYFLKHWNLSNYHPLQSPRKLSRWHTSPPLPAWYRRKPSRLSCRYSTVKQRESGWYWMYIKGHHCDYRDIKSQGNWPNGHPEEEGEGYIFKEPPHHSICIWYREDPHFLNFSSNQDIQEWYEET